MKWLSNLPKINIKFDYISIITSIDVQNLLSIIKFKHNTTQIGELKSCPRRARKSGAIASEGQATFARATPGQGQTVSGVGQGDEVGTG